jgi:hypothetical protein
LNKFKIIQSFNLIRSNYYIRLFFKLSQPINGFLYCYVNTKAEFLDFSIPLYDDHEIKEIQTNLDNNIIKGNLNYNQQTLSIHYYTLQGAILDLYNILIHYSNYKPWTDPKYITRLNKFMSLICYLIKFENQNIDSLIKNLKEIKGKSSNKFNNKSEDINISNWKIYLYAISSYISNYTSSYIEIVPPAKYLFNLFILPIKKFIESNQQDINAKANNSLSLEKENQILKETKLIFQYYLDCIKLFEFYLGKYQSEPDANLTHKKMNVYGNLQIGGIEDIPDNLDELIYHQKYLKYKAKYLKLKKQLF